MVDVDALKAKFAGYPNILARIDFLVERNDAWAHDALRYLDRMKKNDERETVSWDEYPGFEMSLDQLDTFTKLTIEVEDRAAKS